VATAASFARQQIADLAAGRCAAVLVSDFMPRAQCAAVLAALKTAEFKTYDTKRVYPPVMRYGVGVSDYRRDGRIEESYWEAVKVDRRNWHELGLRFDPFEVCRTTLGMNWPGKISVGQSNGRELSPGVAREPDHGFIIHFDDASREFADNLLDISLVAQFAFNLYLSVPEVGGETVVWRHLWHPDDEAHRLPHSYGYADDVVGDAESFEIKPVVGQALLFNPRYFHAVRPSHEARRIALGFSVGLTDTGELVTWG
jgi:hypothetical protein